MRRILTILFLIFSAIFSACKKETAIIPSTVPTRDDRVSILLKDVVEDKLPSPYFHFNYNDPGYVTDVSFADGLVHYDVGYENKRVAFLKNRIDNSRLDYAYADGRVAYIKNSKDGQAFWSYTLVYKEDQLKEIKYYRHQSIDSVLERKVQLFYGTDGNLSSYNDYWNTNEGQLKLSRRFVFSDYDDGSNVDDFYLFKNFFDDFLFLPGLKLQKNNPDKVQIFGDQNDYEIQYSYTYQGRLPVQKQGKFKQTRGGGEGKELLLVSRYAYY